MASKKTKSAATGLQLPANLSFLRSLEPTSGVLEAVKFRGEASLAAVFDTPNDVKVVPVEVTATTVRGTIANDHKDAPEKRVGTGEKSLNAANIATIEQALLPVDAAHLLVSSTIRFSGHAGKPAMCSSPSFREALASFVEAYAKQGGFAELAMRYVLNIANGSWLWRNRFGQDQEIRIAVGEHCVYFREADLDMGQGFELTAVLDASKREQLAKVVALVEAALAGDAPVALQVAGLVRMGPGAEVFPSQEFSSQESEKVVKGRDADKVAKVLSKQRNSAGAWVATIHARKIGNALRSIDTWHGRENVGALAVEVYGANTHQGEAHRVSGNDLYTFLKHPDQMHEEVQAGVTGDHHFVVACLVRGGVFGFASAAKDKGSKEETADGAEE